jgi:DNA-binding GntR family transcriptional regulator
MAQKSIRPMLRSMAEHEKLSPRNHRPPTMAEVALAELRTAIVRGRLPPGTPLRLDALSQELKMSISPVREAVRGLESLGLVDYEAHRGARVRPLSSEELRDIIDVRIALETIAIRRAAEAFSDEDGEIVQAALDRLDRAYVAPDIEEHLAANKDFHFAVYRAGRSPWLIRQLAPAWDTCERYAVALFGVDSLKSDRSRTERAGHVRIVRACLRNDPDAAARDLERHLTVFRSLVESAMSVAPAGAGLPGPPASLVG